jgi:hypothetical protein
MGHTILKGLPNSPEWRRVFERLIWGPGLAADDISKLAALTAEAAAKGFTKAAYDVGLQHTFHILAQTALAGQQPDWRDLLGRAGVPVGEGSCPFDLTAGLQTAVDEHLARHARPTDVSEMAQQAAGEALIEIAATDVPIFGGGKAELDTVVRKLATPEGFSRLGQLFFGRFTARFLNFYLSRITSDHVGTDRIPSIADLSRFNDALRAHCEESAAVVLSSFREWHGETRSPADAGVESTAKLLSAALAKIGGALSSEGADQ